nr:PREDICTED: mismatch repair endonuclease PMS2 isoform X1 [Bemisia tabaci]
MSKTIKAIDREAVHRICSGQVVLNLATAVKELVENSLDAGATTVEVRLREYGSDLIEVSDNGSGVLSDNFQGLTAKHHTSKLLDFSDLVNVETFGFRGEALSSLCALSNVTIITRHESSETGSKLVFDQHGNITRTSPTSRQVGTTVIVEKLFKALPVRQKEFHRNLKREYCKMIQLLNAYGLISTNVRLSCTNQTKKGSRSVVLSTHGCKTVKENIACIFGSKQLNSLLDLKKVLPGNETLAELKVKEEEADKFNFEGIISSCAHGQGRSSGDRQFFYINNRPCEPSKIVKCVNEVYHSFNLHQTPFVFLNITAARHSVDVNVTPDKRQIFLDHEKLLLATIKASLMSLYEKIPSTFQVNNSFKFAPSESTLNLSSESPTTNVRSPSKTSSLEKWRHSSHMGVSELPTNKCKPENKFSQPSKRMKFDEEFVSAELTNTSLEKHENGEQTKGASHNLGLESQDSACSSQSSFSVIKTENIEESQETLGNCRLFNQGSACNSCDVSTPTETSIKKVPEMSVEIIDRSTSLSKTESSCISSNQPASEDDFESFTLISQESSLSVKILDPSSPRSRQSKSEVSLAYHEGISARISGHENRSEPTESSGTITESTEIEETCSESEGEKVEIYEEDRGRIRQQQIVVSAAIRNSADSRTTVMINNVSVKSIKETIEQFKLEESNQGKNSVTNKFHATIDPSKNDQAENELRREISKDSFSKMEIIGQFNLGFIIVQLGTDLFIIDQHATDEKYNFETLQLNTTISNQILVSPLTLELTAANESLLLDNMEIFKKNGFEFIVDEKADPMKKVKLTAIPISQNWHFGKDDIDELLFMLQDSPGALCRPSRVRAMFASRACRMSVMIGTALSFSEMKRLVTHMGEIEQPWNCPHGRPTMRHLVNLALLC